MFDPFAQQGPDDADAVAWAATIEPGRAHAYEIDLWATSCVVAAGHRLRVEIASSCFPRWVRYPQTGEEAVRATAFAPARQEVFHHAARPSHVTLPIVPRSVRRRATCDDVRRTTEARPMAVRDGRGAPTLESVAARAGVSRATAGRVLSGSTTVGPEARDAVLAAAAELRYVTNRAARSLMTRRSDSIGFVVAESEDRFFADPYFSQVLHGAHGVVARHDMQLVFAVVSGDDVERQRFERFALGGHLDGAILVSLHGDDPLPHRLQDAGVPVVLSGRPFAHESRTPLTYVDADNVGGAMAAVRLLAQLGRRRIATITGPLDMAASVDRVDGFRAELAAHDIVDAGAADGDFSIAGGRRAMLDLFAADPAIDGVFAANDLMAAGALQAARELGRRVPEDLAVVGFDDSAIAASAQPALTTVRQPMVEMGRTLATLLLDQITHGGEPQAPVILPTEIVRRDSA